MDHPNTAFIVQARLGSTRLPGKVMLDFPWGDKLIDIIIKKIEIHGKGIPCIVATSDDRSDDTLAEYLTDKGTTVFRGPAEDVLNRFIQCAEQGNIETIIRICADNPFIDIEGTVRLLDKYAGANTDYVAYSLAPGLPSIKSHVGLWGEAVSLKALQKAWAMTDEKKYREHVTNFIYEHPELFNIQFISAPERFYQRFDIRLTMDDREDFLLILKLLGTLKDDIYNFGEEDLLLAIDDHPEIQEMMKAQIEKYQK